jgi:hypothetical protein
MCFSQSLIGGCKMGVLRMNLAGAFIIIILTGDGTLGPTNRIIDFQEGRKRDY